MYIDIFALLSLCALYSLRILSMISFFSCIYLNVVILRPFCGHCIYFEEYEKIGEKER